MAVIKANAYGHGLLAVANALEGADGLAVARLDEALALREAGNQQRILLLGSCLSDPEFQLCAQHQLDIETHSLAMAQQLAGLSLNTKINCWLKMDTGMHRLGLAPREYLEAKQLLEGSSNVAELILMSHFSSSDDNDKHRCQQQTRLFMEAIAGSDAPTSLANSAAIIQHPDSHGDWIRPGIMLYGANPLPQAGPPPLHPAMTLTATVLAIREVPAGDAVGYNANWTASQATRVATIGIGYGDGYPRHARNGTPVLIRGQRAALIGRVSMDMISVDLSDCDGIEVGDEATLWGKQLPVEEIAECAETISYELFTGVTDRVCKQYV